MCMAEARVFPSFCLGIATSNHVRTHRRTGTLPYVDCYPTSSNMCTIIALDASVVIVCHFMHLIAGEGGGAYQHAGCSPQQPGSHAEAAPGQSESAVRDPEPERGEGRVWLKGRTGGKRARRSSVGKGGLQGGDPGNSLAPQAHCFLRGPIEFASFLL